MTGFMMRLTAIEKNLIESSYTKLMENELDLAKCFYRTLFEMAPLIKPLFTGDQKLLEIHFNQLIHFTVKHVNDPDTLKTVLYDLGKRHKNYGANESQFEVVKVALLLSIEYELKGKFSVSIKSAWSKYLDHISQVMINGLLGD